MKHSAHAPSEASAASGASHGGRHPEARSVRIALAGNPNAGKTSLFNHLTGTIQTVSNYPGVTVERKEGLTRRHGRTFGVVDLPGTYSLAAYSQEERVARDFVLEEKPDVVVDVVDASNLERNLYLAAQFMEMRVPLVLALNMCDVAERRGYDVNASALSDMLGVPVVRTCGNTGRGAAELLDACAQVADGHVDATPRTVTYGHGVDSIIDQLADGLAEPLAEVPACPPRWAAVKLLERDEHIAGKLRRGLGDRFDRVDQHVERARQEFAAHHDEDPETVLAERRYGFAAGAVKQCQTLKGEARQRRTDQIDALVCHRLFGPAILVGVVAALFFCVFKVADEWAWIPWVGGWVSPTGLMEWGFEQLSGLIAPLEGPAPMLHSLLNDAVIGGVGGVMSFVPLIFVMFLFISALEDTGYIARVAFILDRVLQTFGLQGKSILALIVSGGLGAGGCAVPGVMATRTLREEKDRLITMLVVPFMNCGAKMPVYAMLVAAFFPDGRMQMMLLLWALSWVVALTAAWALRRFVIRGEQTPFVMELPAYHVPLPRSVLLHTWERTWMYIRKAGTIILAISVVLWGLMYFPRPPAEAEALDQPALVYSAAGRFGKALEPVTQYAGIDWRTNVALVGGFAAKEVIIGTLGTVYAMEDVTDEEFDSLTTQLREDPQWSALGAFALLIFVMMYAPCLATVAVIKRESQSWRWAIFATFYSTTAAFLVAVGVYQAGLFMGLGS
jgi:ferrous iron transport protein B